MITNNETKNKLNHRDYYHVIKIFDNNRYSHTALEIFNEMIEKTNIEPDTKICNVVIKAISNIKSLDNANKIYQYLQEKKPKLIEIRSIQNY